MGNRTINVLNSVFLLQDFDLTPEGTYLAVIIGIVIYSFSLFCNLSLLALIAMDRCLHGPMYLFLYNLSVNDLIGITAMLPRVIADILSLKGQINFPSCLVQAFCIHMYGGATLLILSVMAFDRYIAICHPLRYHTIMSGCTVTSLIVFVWVFDFMLIGTLFGLLLRFPFCGTTLPNFYCNNQALLQTTCAKDTTVNNIYGLFITCILHGIGLFSVVFTYSRILFTCLKNKESESKIKALNTCATHLLVFFIYELSGIVIVLAYRYPDTSPSLQKCMAMSFIIFPASLNPLVFGLKTKEIRKSVTKIFTNRVSFKSTNQPSLVNQE